MFYFRRNKILQKPLESHSFDYKIIDIDVFKKMGFFGFKKDCSHLELSVLKLTSYTTFQLKPAFQKEEHCLSNVVALGFFRFSVDMNEKKGLRSMTTYDLALTMLFALLTYGTVINN